MTLLDIVAVYASTFSPVNIGEHCSPITMFMNRETFKFVSCFSRFNYPFLRGEILRDSFVIITQSKYIVTFFFLLFKDFFTVFSLFVNCKQTENVFRLLTYLLEVSCLIECLKVILSVVVYYLSFSLETETVKSLSKIFCAGQQMFNIGCYVCYFTTFIFFTTCFSVNSCSYE